MFDSIEQIIQKEIRPKLNESYGDIELLNVDDGIVEVKLLGAYSDCPSLKFIVVDMVEQNLKESIPEVKKVVLINDVDKELLDAIKNIFKKTDKESCR